MIATGPSRARVSALLVLFLIGGFFMPAASAHAAESVHISRNWSGYVATDGTYSGVSGSWTVPVSTDSHTAVSANTVWVGVGGVSATDLIQAGTQALVRNGEVEYQAWYEILPDTQRSLPVTIHEGDSVAVSLVETTPGTWHLTFEDVTTGETYQNDIAYASSHSSAEWIVERPRVITGTTTGYLALSNFDDVSFTDAAAIVNGAAAPLAALDPQKMVMGSSGSSILAVPSDLSGSSFSVSRLSLAASDRYTRSFRRVRRTTTPQPAPTTQPSPQAPVVTPTQGGFTIHIIF